MRLLVASSLCALCACASTGPKPQGPQVTRLEIKGADALSAREIKKKILTTENDWLSFLPWEDKQYFDPTAWQADLRRVERFYQANGYYQAKVVADQVRPAGKDGVALLVVVKEGEPTRIAELELTGTQSLPPEHAAKATADLPLAKGDVFVEEAWSGVKDVIRGRLRELGYAEATVEGEVQVDLASRLASVKLVLFPGQRYKFGNLFAATDPKPVVPPKRIIEQASGSVKTGEWYTETALAEAQARVFQMGVFGAVKVNRGAPDRETGTVPVIIDVREAKFHSLRGGPGLGIDAASMSLRVAGEYTDRNFLGGLRRLTVSGLVGWAFIPHIPGVIGNFPGATSGPILKLTTELEQPRFIFRDVRAQLTLDGERGLEPAYRFWAARGRAALTWKPYPTLALTGAYEAELYFLESGNAAFKDVSTLGFGCAGTCILSYVEQVLEWDRRNDKNDPRHGTYVALALQEGGGPLGGSFTYLRVLPDIRGYISFLDDDRLTFSAKLRLGTLLTSGESPIVARFFSGGGFMRGFNGRRLSPMLDLPRDFIDKPEEYQRALRREIPSGDVTPVGGNGLFEASFEARYAFPNDLMLATFVDMGFVSEGSLPLTGLFSSTYYAVGAGLRYLTMVGAIRLDFAYRLPVGPPLVIRTGPPPSPGLVNGVPKQVLLAPTPTYEDRSGGCFGIGSKIRPVGSPLAGAGSPEDPCVVQISIGQAF